MARQEPRSGAGVRILMGVARVLAAAVIAVVASAALADLNLRPIEFSRILPVVLTGEGIIYILMLGGGTVAAPILLLSVVLGFVLRAGIAVAAGVLSPQVGGDLLANAQFFYASYWPAAIAQVLMVAVALRVVRPLIATRRRRLRRGDPEVAEALHDARLEEERHDALLVAIAEDTDMPPVSPTVLEEREIGDLADTVTREEPDEEAAPEAPALPFEQEEPEAEEEPEVEPEAVDVEESPLPPGVVDATPEVRAAVEEAARQQAEAPDEPQEVEEPDEQAPAPPPEEDVEATDAELEPEPDAPEPPESEAAAAVADEAVGEDTAPFAPVARRGPAETAQARPAENLQGMIDVISDAAGEGTDVRVWRTSDGRTVLAAVPSGTPAAGTGGHADALVSAHLEVCAWLGSEPISRQLAATSLGAWALQALDPAGAMMLLMAARGDAAAGRIELAAERAVTAVRAMAEAAAGDALNGPTESASALSLTAAPAPAEAINAAAARVGGRFAACWQAWRGPQGRIIAAHAAPGVDAEEAARKTGRLLAPAVRFADAVALDGPRWLAIPLEDALLAMHWAERDGESTVLAVTVSGAATLGRVRWELGEIARLIEE